MPAKDGEGPNSIKDTFDVTPSVNAALDRLTDRQTAATAAETSNQIS